MHPEELNRITDDAFLKSAFDYVPSFVPDPLAYLANARAEFAASRIFPCEHLLSCSDIESKAYGVPTGPRLVWFVTKSSSISVFFDNETQQFGAASGPFPNGTYHDLGFRSPDPLEMHLS